MAARKPLVVVPGSPAVVGELPAGDTVNGAASGMVASGPVTLLAGSIPDGTFLRRNGGSIEGAAPASALQLETSQGWQQPDNTRNTQIVTASLGANAGQFGNGGVSVFQDSTGLYTSYNTGALAGLNAGISHVAGVTQRGSGPMFTCRMRVGPTAPGDLQDVRIWCGLFSGDPMASDDPALHLAAFRYSTSVPDTPNFWTIAVKDGVTMARTLGVAGIAPDGYYVLQVDCRTPGAVVFLVNGVQVGSLAVNLPGVNTALGGYCMVRNLAAAAKVIRWGRWHFLNP